MLLYELGFSAAIASILRRNQVPVAGAYVVARKRNAYQQAKNNRRSQQRFIEKFGVAPALAPFSGLVDDSGVDLREASGDDDDHDHGHDHDHGDGMRAEKRQRMNDEPSYPSPSRVVTPSPYNFLA